MSSDHQPGEIGASSKPHETTAVSEAHPNPKQDDVGVVEEASEHLSPKNPVLVLSDAKQGEVLLLPVEQIRSAQVDDPGIEQPPLTPSTEESSTQLSISSVIPVIVVIVIVFFLARRVSKRTEARVPTHEELRRLRESHLDGYMSMSTENRGGAPKSEPNVKRDEKDRSPEQQNPKSEKKDVAVDNQRSEARRRLRASLLKNVPARKWQPLRTAKELLEWVPGAECLKMASSTPLQKRKASSSKMLMICHDMAGNYAEDAILDGWYPHSNQACSDSWVWGFRPCHLAYTEAFVYFSHAFISIPPRGWIDAAHRHGTKVFGTFLTEWDAGGLICDEVFATRETAVAAAKQLHSISKAFGFEGWLVNIENKLNLEQIPNVFAFLETLSNTESTMVVWYDSVISDTGELKWQNGLTARNIEFFRRANCGILTNYGWTEERVNSSNLLANSEPGRTAAHVWHGIDVFGRGTFGGGGMSCDLALNVLDQYQSPSACLFAPGWILEEAAQRNPQLGKKTELQFWNKIIQNTAWGERVCHDVVANITKQALCTDFCDGGGTAFYASGERLSSLPWLDLRRQTLQPRWDVLTPDEGEDAKTQKRVTIRSVDSGPVFAGNSAVQLVGRRFGITNESWFFFPLISLEARLGGDLGPASKLRVTAAILALNGDVALCLDIAARDPNKPSSRLRLVPKDYLVDDTLPASTERACKGGWILRSWELRTQELRGRALVGVGVSPLPVSAIVGTSWMDVRIGMISLDETGIDPENCRPKDIKLDRDSLSLSWSCGCGEPNRCTVTSCLVFVNGKFRQCAFGQECQVNDISIFPSGQLEDTITLKAMRWDGSMSDEVAVQSQVS